MKSWSVDEMLAEGPCDAYPRERLVELWAGRERLTLDEVLALDISDSDRVWAITRGLEGKQLWVWLERVVTRAVTEHALHCGVEAVEEWAARWLSGEDRTMAAALAARYKMKDRGIQKLAWAAMKAAEWAAVDKVLVAALWAQRAWTVEQVAAEIKRQIADYRAV